MAYAILITDAPEHSSYAIGRFVARNGKEVALQFKDRRIPPEVPKTWRTLAGATKFMKTLNWPGFRFTVEEV